MTEQWHYAKGTQRFGPVAPEELRQLAQNGHLAPTDLVWKMGMREWVQAGSIQGLQFPAYGQQGGYLPQQAATPAAPAITTPAAGVSRPFAAPAATGPAASASPTPAGGIPSGGFPNTGFPNTSFPNTGQPAATPASAAQANPYVTQQASGAATGGPAAGPSAAEQVPYFDTRLNVGAHAFTRGSHGLRQSFGGAINGFSDDVAAAVGALISNPFSIVFATLVYWICSYLSVLLIVTALFYPMFVMGYLTLLDRCSRGQKFQLSSLISFTRHGWNAVWHLLSLLASLFVIIGTFVAPVILGLGALYVIGGTFGLIASILGDTVSSTSYQPRGFGQPGILDSLINNLMPFDSVFLRIALVTLLSIAIQTPLHAGWFLYCYLLYDVSITEQKPGTEFRLVLDGLSRTLDAGKLVWKEIFFCGLLISTLAAGFPVLLRFVPELFSDKVTVWFGVVIVPLLMFLFGLFYNVFAALTCVRIRERMPQQES